MLKKLAIVAQNFLFPPICYLCNKPLASAANGHFCLHCEQKLKTISSACYCCGRPLSVDAICGECLKHPPHYQRTISAFAYEGEVKMMLLNIKFHHGQYFIKPMAEALAHRLFSAYHKESWPQCIIPVPLYAQRTRQRGFNQSVELAKIIHKKVQIPLSYNKVIRTKNTEQQTRLNVHERVNNLKNAFQSPALDYEHIAIIDDVVTTGSTVNALARTLKQRGIKKIDIWCVARGVPNN